MFALLITTACSDSSKTELALKITQAELAEVRTALDEAEARLAQRTNAPLVHLVLLNLKDDLPKETLESFRSEVKKLGTINLIQDFEMGSFADVGDQRALTDYEFVLKMTFKNREEMAKYQVDSLHAAVRDQLGSYLAGPPAVYDYDIQ